MLLFMDTETSDLLKRNLALEDPSQPWCVELAADLSDMDGTTRDFFSVRVRADGRQVRPDAQAVHGITTREAARSGVSEIAALGMLVGLAAQARYLIGHAVEFDRDVIVATLRRLKRDDRMLVRAGIELVCTMKAAAPVCRIPSDRGDGQFLWPSLDAACETVLGEPPRAGRHSAWQDCQRAKRLFLALRERKMMEAA
jgi:DNA polymerase III epsilon subunit-like protein